jgi:hypothetical protein
MPSRNWQFTFTGFMYPTFNPSLRKRMPNPMHRADLPEKVSAEVIYRVFIRVCS